jgi:hypothetical protein
VDIDAWNAHAERFFATRIGLADAPSPLAAGPDYKSDARPGLLSTRPVRFVVAPQHGSPGIRAASVRVREPEDLVLAEQADAPVGPTGLVRLARRCEAVWLVERLDPSDTLGLRLATILASVLLGPILDPDSQSLFGVKTARAKIEAAR